MQRQFYTKRALEFIGKNRHAASAQNLQQTPAGFLLRFPKRHRQLLPQDTLHHLVEVGIHSVDLSAAALLLGLLLPQLLEQGQVLVKIIGVEQRLIMFCQRCLYPRRDGQLLLFDACKVGCRLLWRGHRAQGIFHKVCLVQSAQNAQYKSCAKLPLQIPGGQAIMISYNE